MDIKKELQVFKKDIDYEIENYLDSVIEEVKETDLFVYDAMRYFKKTILAGGKRIRPIMMCWGYKAAGGKDYNEILKTSISIELIHAFLLIHDDVIDRDDMRRGKKTIHARYRDYDKWIASDKDANHFGISIAIVLGDLIYSLGNQILFEAKFESHIVIQALSKMQRIVGLTCIGEMQDVYMEYTNKATEADILKMYENKTAKYTFEGPLQLGAMLAGASDTFCAELSAYAVPLGIAFQIRDDMLGVFGNQKKMGKPVGSDITEGKRTLIVSRAYQSATNEQKNVLNKLLGNTKISSRDIKIFQSILIDTGARQSVENYMQKLVEQSETALDDMSLQNGANEFLFSLAEYLNNREN